MTAHDFIKFKKINMRNQLVFKALRFVVANIRFLPV